MGDWQSVFFHQVSKDFEKELKNKLVATKSAAIVPIRRGGSHNALRYLITSGLMTSLSPLAHCL